MLETISTVVVTLVSIYLLAGLLFALPFLLRGAARLDPSAQHGSGGFRAVILPGTVALWPVLAWKWRIAARQGK
jgi:hypothetical protein